MICKEEKLRSVSSFSVYKEDHRHVKVYFCFLSVQVWWVFSQLVLLGRFWMSELLTRTDSGEGIIFFFLIIFFKKKKIIRLALLLHFLLAGFVISTWQSVVKRNLFWFIREESSKKWPNLDCGSSFQIFQEPMGQNRALFLLLLKIKFARNKQFDALLQKGELLNRHFRSCCLMFLSTNSWFLFSFFQAYILVALWVFFPSSAYLLKSPSPFIKVLMSFFVLLLFWGEGEKFFSCNHY